MGNFKHAMAAFLAVSLVGSLAVVQADNVPKARATKLTQEISTEITSPAVLLGDGEGETPEFGIFSSNLLMFLGQEGYILTDGSSINLYETAYDDGSVIGTLHLGDKVKFTSLDGGWFGVETDGKKGFIHAEYATLDYEEVKRVLLATSMYLSGTTTQSINVRGMASEESVILTQISQGTSVIILETTENGWHKVYYGADYDIGYVSADYIEVGDMVKRADVSAKRTARINKIAKPAKIKVTSGSVEVKALPSADSETITKLGNGINCKVLSGGTNWTKILITSTNEIGYVRTSNVQLNSATTSAKKTKTSKSSSNGVVASGSGSSLVNQASKYIGTRYVYGGTSPSGFDCSGLVQYSLRKLGVSVGRSSRDQYNCGVAVSRSNLQAGDLVFFSRGGSISHVAIYAGNGQVIHAPSAGKRVCYQSLSSLTNSLHYVGARRVIQ